MRRREVITLLGSAAAWPIAARAQQPIPRIGLVSIGADPSNPVVFIPFLKQIRELGYIDGQNIILEQRFAAGHDDLISSFVADLLQRKVDILVVTGQRESIAAKNATSDIPIVTIVNPDPIAMGMAKSLSRPGGNVTGLTTLDYGIYGKRIELLKQSIPGLTKAALIVSRRNPTFKADSEWARENQSAARALGMSLEIVEFEADKVETTIDAAVKRGAQGLVAASDGVIIGLRKEIAEIAMRQKLPTMFALRQNVEAGGLMSYSARVADLSRRAAFFVDRILKGARPADLPIEQPTTFELVINLKTAKLLGITLPPSLLALADEVIE
ncbi:MAG: ABC transporter substrate-binding protein [Xanthobacteraceae bacterium]|jgi:putative tryptophan/tyrosine transport system substrate-binding protein